MKKNIAFILFIICFPFTIYSQKWQQYSDSIMSNIRKNDLEKVISPEKNYTIAYINLACIFIYWTIPKY